MSQPSLISVLHQEVCRWHFSKTPMAERRQVEQARGLGAVVVEVGGRQDDP